MGDRASGALRWGGEERRLVDQYLADGRLDPTRVRSSTYLRSVKRLEDVWERHPKKNFNQNIRRQATQWQIDRKRDGGRRLSPADSDSEAEVAESGDESEYEEDAPDTPPPLPSSGPWVSFGNQPRRRTQANPPPPALRSPRQVNQDQSVQLLLAGLHIGTNPSSNVIEQATDMLIHHMYVWDEAIHPEEEDIGSNVRLGHLSIDILLPGPTHLTQIRAIVSSDGNTLNFTYGPQNTSMSANRTTVRLAQGALGASAADNEQVRQTMSAAARVQAHRNALEKIRPQLATKVIAIPLPFQCDRHFCRRDDWGRDNHADGITMGLYQHEDAEFTSNNQYVWILHIELSARECPDVGPMSPAGFNIFNA